MARAARRRRRAENVAYVQRLLGDLELARGRPPRPRAYAAALAAVPDYVPAPPGARAGRRQRRPRARSPAGRVMTRSAAGVRDRARRDRAWRRAAGRGRRDSSWCGPSRRCSPRGRERRRRAGDVEADHGDRGAPWRSRARVGAAPSVRSADALGWALTRAGGPDAGLRWARRALRLGSLDAGFRYHAGDRAPAPRPRPPAPASRPRPRPGGPAAARRARAGGAGGSMIGASSRRRGRARPLRRASAHPLGNFSVNHLTQVSFVRPRRRALHPRPGRDPDVPGARDGRRRAAGRKQAEVSAGLLTVDGRRVELRAAGARRSRTGGAGGLDTTRVELPLTACVGPGRVALRDGTFRAASGGRRSWSSRTGNGGAPSAPAGDPTNGLRSYPEDLLRSPRPARGELRRQPGPAR